MNRFSRRISRERQTVAVMIGLYCRKKHRSSDLCGECRELLDYALERIETCPFQGRKTTCARCPVHCYPSVMRERIRIVMRYAGPQMLFRHPALAIMHLIECRYKAPVRL